MNSSNKERLIEYWKILKDKEYEYVKLRNLNDAFEINEKSNLDELNNSETEFKVAWNNFWSYSSSISKGE